MAVSTTDAFSGPYITNGVTIAFPFAFKAPSTAEVSVLLRDADGAELTPPSFSVALGVDEGGTVTFVSAPPAGNTLVVLLDPFFTQDLEFENGSAWLAEPVNEGYDRSALRDQVLRRDVNRSIMAPIGEVGMQLPPAEVRKNKFLGFSGVDGKPIATEGISGDDILRPDLASTDAGKGGDLVGLITGESVQERFDLLFRDGPENPTSTTMAVKLIHDRVGGLLEQQGIWNNEQRWTFGLNDKIQAGDGTTTDGPSGLMFLRLDQAGSPADAVVLMNVMNVTASNCTGFAENNIATCLPGLVNVKLVVGEDDWEPSLGVTINSGSICRALNAFSTECPVGIQFGGVGGGSFTNGIAAYGISDFGTFLGAGAGEVMQTLIDTGAAVFNGAAIKLSAAHRHRWTGGGRNYDVWADTAGALIFTNPNIIAFRDEATSTNPLVISKDGIIASGRAASVSDGYQLSIAQFSSSEGSGIANFKDSTGVQAMQIFIARGSPPNGAAATVKLGNISSNGRSLNASGTINASGADYAEYEKRSDSCGQFAKGALVGFDANGKLTDRYAAAISFGVKSTNPNLVGGDDWCTDLVPPLEPVFEPAPYEGPKDPGSLPPKAPFEEGYVEARANLQALAAQMMVAAQQKTEGPMEAFGGAQDAVKGFKDRQLQAQDALHAEWQEERVAYDAAIAAYLDSVDVARAEWEATIYADYQAAVVAFNAEMDVRRAPYERIAYCGKVPVNVLGAAPGQLIIAVAGGDGSIEGVAKDYADTMVEERDLRCVGKVRRILDDGRAEIVVAP